MSQQLSTGAGRLNDAVVTPETARLLVHMVMFATSQLTPNDPRRPEIYAAMMLALAKIEPFGPFNDVFKELKRIGGIGAAT